MIVVTSRSGESSGNASRSGLHDGESYLRTNLGFVGLTDVTFVHAEKGFRKHETEGFHGQTLNAITELVHFAPWFSVQKLRAMAESDSNRS